jgi:hypothetical protein
MTNEKFYLRGDYIAWVCRDPDNADGEQYTYHMFNAHMIRRAADMDTKAFFDSIGSSCVKYIVSDTNFGFTETEHYFDNVPGDYEDCTAETMTALIGYANERIEETDEDEDEYEM